MDLQAILEQSISTATFYFTHAIKEVDEIFDEEGFAKKNPEILLEFVRTAREDFNTMVSFQKIEKKKAKKYNSILQFCEEHLEFKEGGFAYTSEIYERYLSLKRIKGEPIHKRRELTTRILGLLKNYRVTTGKPGGKAALMNVVLVGNERFKETKELK